MTVCYFTGSGNCLYVARRIGGTLLSIPQLMRQESIEIADEAVGIVCPVYNCEMPMMVRDFLNKAHIRTEYFFFVYTYGMGCGRTRPSPIRSSTAACIAASVPGSARLTTSR